MKKQRRRIYAALLCSSMVLSLVSMPVSAAETGQLTNPPTSTEELHSPESASGNEAAAVLNGLYAALPVANGVKEVATADELTDALADSSISGITLKRDIDIGSTLTINRTVTLDLNGCVLKMTGGGSVIKVESGGDLTIQLPVGFLLCDELAPGGGEAFSGIQFFFQHGVPPILYCCGFIIMEKRSAGYSTKGRILGGHGHTFCIPANHTIYRCSICEFFL